MPTGWIRAYDEEDKHVKSDVPFFERSERGKFRQSFSTPVHNSSSASSPILATLKWGAVVELPNGLASSSWTRIIHKNKPGFVKSKHLVEVAFVARKSGTAAKNFSTKMEYDRFDVSTQTSEPSDREVIWGDLVQVLKWGSTKCDVRVRGTRGQMKRDDIATEGLLDVYFIDVGQGDGILVRTPDSKHMLIDGGLARIDQQTGKNAADLVDWKFFIDYGDHRVRLDSLMASHSDADHFGGLHDLLRDTKLADRELDCVGVDVETFHHPGLSRRIKSLDSEGLGKKNANGNFVQLLDDRSDAETAVTSSSKKLSPPWIWFVRDVLGNSKKTKVKRVMVSREHLQTGKPLPTLWKPDKSCSVEVLAPVSFLDDGTTALPDLGSKGKNTNGHSICLRLKYKRARILLTGDLNSKSMNWLEACYGDRISLFKCDVAKACHHGSHDVSYRFLEAINAAATVICSGDAEGHAHPRPEIVAASACTGHKDVDRAKDRLLTPLIYMTEIQRSVTIGAINRIDLKNVTGAADNTDQVVLGRPIDEINDKGFLTPSARKSLRGKSKAQQKKIIKDTVAQEKPNLKAMETATQRGTIRADFNLTVPLGPVEEQNETKRGWRTRLMQKTHYGMVTVRTDGKTIMCATLEETGDEWTIHTFPARFTAD